MKLYFYSLCIPVCQENSFYVEKNACLHKMPVSCFEIKNIVILIQGEMIVAIFKLYIVFCYVYVYKVTNSSNLQFGMET